MIHEDDRRILESWPEAKVIRAKKNCIVGDHYHQVKTEKFVVLNGVVVLAAKNKNIEIMEIGKIYKVNPGEWHLFNMEEGSVMIGLCSHVYDPTDDYKTE